MSKSTDKISKVQNRKLHFAGLYTPPSPAAASPDTLKEIARRARGGDLGALSSLPLHTAQPQAIFADDSGQTWAFTTASDGSSVAHQWNEAENGGVLTCLEEFQSASRPPLEKSAAHEQLRMTAMALAVGQFAARRDAKAEKHKVTKRQATTHPESPSDARSQQRGRKTADKPSDLERTTESVIKQILSGLGGKLLTGHSLTEIIEDLRLSKETSALWNNLGYGAFHHLMGAAITSYVQMKLGEAIASLWKVNDTDSMGEQLAHHAAFDLFWKMKGSLLSAAPFGDLPFLSPTSGTEWSNWWNGIFNGAGSEATFPMAHLGSAHAADGTIMTGAGKVWVEGKKVARLGDEAVLAKPPDSGSVVATGFPTVTIEGVAVAVAKGSDFVLGKGTGAMAPITVGAAKTFLGFPPATPSTAPKGAPADTAISETGKISTGADAVRNAEGGWFKDFLEPMLGVDGAGQYTALFGSIVLGSPEFPGAGTSRIPTDENPDPDYQWLVPDSLFGFDMSAYYVFHDANFGTTGSVAGEEIPAFASGIVGSVGMSQVPLQAIYSLATTIANILQRGDQFKPTKNWPPDAPYTPSVPEGVSPPDFG